MGIRLMDENDLYNLCHWRNENSSAFFCKKQIDMNQQCDWFQNYMKSPNDLMFIVYIKDIDVGCMGIRLIEGLWDIYNVILGIKSYGGLGLMSKALKDMMWVVRYKDSIIAPVMAKVLRYNPAVHWYERNQFKIIYEHADYYDMKYTGEL